MNLKQISRMLRRNQTVEEKSLWRSLRDRRFAGFKFRRQHVLGSYVLDFYCAEARLAVELDGSQHGHPEGLQRDAEREKFLSDVGVATLRFSNHQWRTTKEGCLLEIWNMAQQRTGCVQVIKNVEKQTFAPPDLSQIILRQENKRD